MLTLKFTRKSIPFSSKIQMADIQGTPSKGRKVQVTHILHICTKIICSYYYVMFIMILDICQHSNLEGNSTNAYAHLIQKHLNAGNYGIIFWNCHEADVMFPLQGEYDY